MSRSRAAWKEPEWMTECYYNVQAPLYVGCPNPNPSSMAPPVEEERDSSEPDEGTTGSPPGLAHDIGDCSPCAYFWQKADGCRLGDECQYCHLCDRDAIRRWKKAKKQRKKADALRNAATNRNSRKKPAGVVSASKKPVGVVNTSNFISPVVAEPARVTLSMESSPTGTMSSLIGMSRPYLPLEVLAGPPGLGMDLTVSSGKMGFGEMLPDDDSTGLWKTSQLLGQDGAKLGDNGTVDSQFAASQVTSVTGLTTSTSFSINMDTPYRPSSFLRSALDGQAETSSFSTPVNVFPYLEQRQNSLVFQRDDLVNMAQLPMGYEVWS